MKFQNPTFEFLQAPDQDAVLKLLERITRVCYKSESRIKDGSAEKLIAGVIDSGHEAMIEHVVITVLAACDRGISHELVRHRIASYSQQSTRYCNYTDEDKFGAEIAYIDLTGGMQIDAKVMRLLSEQVYLIYQEWLAACDDAERHYIRMIGLGATPQIARSVLNNSTKTEIVITMNLREWRHFFKLRAAKDAHPQMRELVTPMLETFAAKWPVIFGSIKGAGL